VLLESIPNTAIIRAVKSLAKALKVIIGRVKFTPDLLPSDVPDCEILNTEKHSMIFTQGSI
jgi:MoxR-like ATPase